MLREKAGKLRDSIMSLYIRANSEVDEFKKDEAGMEVIQVVMLIAVGVLAIAAVWAGVNGLLEKWWIQITGASTGAGPSGIAPPG